MNGRHGQGLELFGQPLDSKSYKPHWFDFLQLVFRGTITTGKVIKSTQDLLAKFAEAHGPV